MIHNVDIIHLGRPIVNAALKTLITGFDNSYRRFGSFMAQSGVPFILSMTRASSEAVVALRIVLPDPPQPAHYAIWGVLCLSRKNVREKKGSRTFIQTAAFVTTRVR